MDTGIPFDTWADGPEEVLATALELLAEAAQDH